MLKLACIMDSTGRPLLRRYDDLSSVLPVFRCPDDAAAALQRLAQAWSTPGGFGVCDVDDQVLQTLERIATELAITIFLQVT